MSTRSKLAVGASTALAAALTLTAAGGTAASASTAHRSGASYVALKGGATSLRLDPGTAQVLSANGISVAPASEARVKGGAIAFPVQGGLLNATTLAGKVTHSGGLTFTAGGKDLTLRDFTINTKKGKLSGYADEAGMRLPVLNLNLHKAKVKAARTHLKVSNVKATLTAKAAAALDSYYGTSLFKGGLTIGTATIKASSQVVRG